MNKYIINHLDSDGLMTVEAETPSKAKYKNFLEWEEVFGRYEKKDSFTKYLAGFISCRKVKEVTE